METSPVNPEEDNSASLQEGSTSYFGDPSSSVMENSQSHTSVPSSIQSQFGLQSNLPEENIRSSHPGHRSQKVTRIIGSIATPRVHSSQSLGRDRARSHSLSAVFDDSNTKRRSSSRSIKRRRFDDEIVESSLGAGGPIASKISRSRNPSASSPAADQVAVPGPAPTPPVQPENIVLSNNRRRTKPPRRNRKSRHGQSVATKDLGRWKPTDDLALIIAVQQTNDLRAVHRGVKFSCHFTLSEVAARWYALLYDPAISRLAVTAMRNLHPELANAVRAKALFSRKEEQMLADIKSSSNPTLESFQEMLDKNPHIFYPTRTAKSLFTHWQAMKQYHLLNDQSVQNLPRGDPVFTFSDAEEILNDAELNEPRDEALEQELAIADRRVKREIRTLENEIGRWQVLVDSVTGISPPDFDNQTLAVLRGRLVRYLMRSREITLGRSTRDMAVDVDLSLEGPAWKVSRRQGTIRLRNNGDFFLACEGRRPIYVDGRPILAGNKFKLNNNSVIEIAGLRFIFLVNLDLINVIRQEAAKLNLQS